MKTKTKMKMKRLLSICVILICVMHIQALSAACVTSSSTCQNIPFTNSKSGQFETTFKVTPLAGSIDVVTGLSGGQASSAANMACAIRFRGDNVIVARNGGAWDAASTVSYTANTEYSFRLAVDVTAQTFSIYVKPAGGSEVTLGSNFAFRVQASSLVYWSVVDVEGHGTVTACDFAITGDPSAVAPNIANETSLSASPNPSSDQVNIKYTLNEPGKVTLSLYDMSGKQLRTIEDGYKEKGLHEKIFDITAFPNGTYYIDLIYKGGRDSFKLLKQNIN